MHRLHLAFALGMFLLAVPVFAQGKSGKSASNATASAKARKVTPAGAVDATREMLVKHGFIFVRTEQVGLTQVIYYHRGNMGKGKGQGPIQKMIIKPSNDVVVFESAPSPAFLVDIRIRLGL